MQFGALLASLKLPFSQGLQVRSAVALGGTTTRSPLAQTACVVQNPFFSELWYAPSGQLVHSGALLVSEKLPAAHGAHRSGDGSLALATNVPGVHGCVASQNG